MIYNLMIMPIKVQNEAWTLTDERIFVDSSDFLVFLWRVLAYQL